VAILSVKLDLPDNVLKKYELRGPIDKVLSETLTDCVNFTSTKPIYITDTQRKRLERLFGKNFKDADELIHMMERYVTARIGDVDVQLPPQLLTRLKTRCFGKPFEQFLVERVIEGLELYAGMR
jgi:hypothetical protein